ALSGDHQDFTNRNPQASSDGCTDRAACDEILGVCVRIESYDTRFNVFGRRAQAGHLSFRFVFARMMAELADRMFSFCRFLDRSHVWGLPMLKTRNPGTIAPPVGAYSHSVEVPPNARWLSIAGQAGIRPDGSLAEGFEEQHDQIWQNTLAILADAGMGPEDLVHLTVYSTDPSGLKFLAAHRKKYLR